MKKSTLLNKKKLAGYSAMAAAFIAGATEADAQIIYVDITDITVDLGFYIPLDIDGGGYNDIILQAASNTMYPWTYVNGFGNLSSAGYGGPNNAFQGYAGDVFPYASALDSGATISAGASFVSNAANYAIFASVFSGSTYGPWADETDKYLGFKFDIDGELHYGWMRLDIFVTPVSFTIKDWAYNSNPDEMIIAGDMGAADSEITFNDAAVTEDEGVGTVTVEIEISDPNDCTVGVEIDGGLTTATEGADFNYVDPSPIVFTAGGATTATFDIAVFDDVDFEIPETIVFNLVDISGSCIMGAVPTHTLTINDNDAPPAVSFVNAEEETAEIGTDFPITIHLSDSYDCTVEVTLNDALTTATEGSDFTFSVPSPVTFVSGGPISQTFNVSIIDDVVMEGDEDIVFNLSAATGCILGEPDQTTLRILENDATGPDPSVISFSWITDAIIEETDAVNLAVNIDVANDCSIDVQVNTALSTADNGVDFTFDDPQTLTFTSGGPTTAEFTVLFNEDLAVEGDEVVVFELTNVTGDCITDVASELLEYTIMDDDQLSINNLAEAGIDIYSAENIIYVSFTNTPEDGSTLQLLDAAGKLVFSSGITSKEQQFSIGDIAEGIYFTQLIVGKNRYEKKLWLGGK